MKSGKFRTVEKPEQFLSHQDRHCYAESTDNQDSHRQFSQEPPVLQRLTFMECGESRESRLSHSFDNDSNRNGKIGDSREISKRPLAVIRLQQIPRHCVVI